MSEEDAILRSIRGIRTGILIALVLYFVRIFCFFIFDYFHFCFNIFICFLVSSDIFECLTFLQQRLPIKWNLFFILLETALLALCRSSLSTAETAVDGSLTMLISIVIFHMSVLTVWLLLPHNLSFYL